VGGLRVGSGKFNKIDTVQQTVEGVLGKRSVGKTGGARKKEDNVVHAPGVRKPLWRVAN